MSSRLIHSARTNSGNGPLTRLASMLRKYSITIRGHRTSFSLEPEFHDQLVRFSRAANISLSALVARIDTQRSVDQSLSSAIRLFVLNKLKPR